MVIVTIYYGPYEAFGTIRHRIQRINGLFVCLKRMGYVVQIIPSDFLNRLCIEMCGIEVFRCDIRNLKFNIPCNDDKICAKAVEAVEEARYRIVSEDVYQETIINQHEVSKLLSTAALYSSNVLLHFNRSGTLSQSPSKKKMSDLC